MFSNGHSMIGLAIHEFLHCLSIHNLPASCSEIFGIQAVITTARQRPSDERNLCQLHVKALCDDAGRRWPS